MVLLSSLPFIVCHRPDAGRGCVATRDIDAGTIVLVLDEPLAAVVFRPFRREACALCFRYDPYKRLTVSDGSGIWFCSQTCLDDWRNHHGILLSDWHALENAYAKHVKRKNKDQLIILENKWFDLIQKPPCSTSDVESCWIALDEKLIRYKSRSPDLTLDEAEYDLARMTAMAIARLQEVFSLNVEDNDYGLEHMLDEPNSRARSYSHLQAEDAEQALRYSGQLRSQMKVFMFLKRHLPSSLNQWLDISSFRHFIGAEAVNAFGIWQLPLIPESECVGSALYPESSYFNHCCTPNLRKERSGRKMAFIASCSINKGEELCISYGTSLPESRQERSKILQQQWFFKCSCKRCINESK